MSITPSIEMELYRTGDMAQATYLRTKGIRHFTMEVIEYEERPDSAEWVYTMTPRLRALLDDYKNGDALVEPRKFNITLRQVRQELYAFLDMESEQGP